MRDEPVEILGVEGAQPARQRLARLRIVEIDEPAVGEDLANRNGGVSARARRRQERERVERGLEFRVELRRGGERRRQRPGRLRLRDQDVEMPAPVELPAQGGAEFFSASRSAARRKLSASFAASTIRLRKSR